VVILNADPFSISSRGEEAGEQKKAVVAEAVAEVVANPSSFNGAWVLIGGESSGFGRDGRRPGGEHSDSQLLPPLTQILVDAGALGTIQRGTLPLKILDGHVVSWDRLPELPDIKLMDTQYDEIRSMVELGETVELEFDIRNWFKMGPVPYHNIVGVIPGTTYPDEWVILGGHFDSFDGGTGGVDDGSGFSPGMEALRLIKMAGGAPKRSIAMILFAAEEIGLVGSQDWVADNVASHDKIVTMINRDGSPSAITGATVPPGWFDDLEEITVPLVDLNPRWPFELSVNHYPSTRPTSPGGSDHSSFAMAGIPTFRFRTETDYSYGRAWHTLYDTYSELVPYQEHQEHSALITAVVAYGIANLDEPLTREGTYLPDGLFADITASSGARVIVSLDFENAPIQSAYFVRMVEGGGGSEGGGRGRNAPPIGRIERAGGGMIQGVLDSPVQRSVRVDVLPATSDSPLSNEGPGMFGLSGTDGFFLTVGRAAEAGPRGEVFGEVVAGAHTLGDFSPGDEIRGIRILRSGDAARAFATDDEAFQRLLRGR
jgi:hypothetical protein